MRVIGGLLVGLACTAIGCGPPPTTMPAPPTGQMNAHADMPDMPAHAAKSDKPAGPQQAVTMAGGAKKIVIDNFTFDPPELTVSAGTEVVWVNRDDVPHTATSTAKPKAFDSGALDTDQTYSHVFKTAGEYEYFCAVHPKMTGKVIVK